jgi:hypothetical protein
MISPRAVLQSKMLAFGTLTGSADKRSDSGGFAPRQYWYVDVIDGDMGYDDLTEAEAEARERFPAAFRTEQGPG